MSDTVSSKRRRAYPRKCLKREMSLSDVHMVIREYLGAELGNLSNWPNRNISGAIQRLGDTKDEEGVAQIHNDVLAQRDKEFASVSAQW